MIASILGLATSVGSMIGGAVGSRNQMNKARGVLGSQKSKNDAWYSRKYNEDYTQTPEVQRMLTLAQDAAQRHLRSARGTQAVMGGTEESVAQAQENAAQMYGNVLGDAAAKATAYKQYVDKEYRDTDSTIANKYFDAYKTQASQIAQAGSQGMKAGMDLVGDDIQAKLKLGKGLFESVFSRA